MTYNTAKGTRDFLPLQTSRRTFIFETIKKVFNLHGFQNIETPAIENLATLNGKYGQEGDKLLFRILNSGNFLENIDLSQQNSSKELANKICDKGLRYDLTVPFARFVVNHFNDINLPFKRYQIQPVWRADRPQKGRYREFMQCDCDIIGSNSIVNEAELIEIIEEVFSALNLQVTIKVNNRKILAALAILIGKEDCLTDITIAIDKIEKIGLEKVLDELRTKDFTPSQIDTLKPFLVIEGSNEEKLSQLKDIFRDIEIGLKGIEEIEQMKDLISQEIEIDLTLARGLNYYTGMIFEVKSKEIAIGSLLGGGRYDNLTGIFGHAGISGVGISFGADRIYDCLDQLGRFDPKMEKSSDILFINFGFPYVKTCLQYAKRLRAENISCEVFPHEKQISVQTSYAAKKGISFVAYVGEDEIKSGNLTIKTMASGEQGKYSFEQLKTLLKQTNSQTNKTYELNNNCKD
ncbi:MAG: histidine--tRNA ligase [Bacteroidales bacterium]|jgi:histidyl-tRNA synthetase|nr:histidine--tRNA ligase [Bacteroidales bacterium]